MADLLDGLIQLTQAPELIQVSSKEELSRNVASHLSEGFEVVLQDPESVHLVKRKRFQPKYLFLLLLWIFPFFVYLTYYRYVERDRLVEVRIAPAGPLPRELGGPPPPEAQAPRGAGTVPPQLAPDGTHWWDGRQWHRVSG